MTDHAHAHLWDLINRLKAHATEGERHATDLSCSVVEHYDGAAYTGRLTEIITIEWQRHATPMHETRTPTPPPEEPEPRPEQPKVADMLFDLFLDSTKLRTMITKTFNEGLDHLAEAIKKEK